MRKVYTLLTILITGYTSFSQEAFTSTSGSGQAGNIIFDWSLGEMTLVNTVQNGNLMLTQGFYQGKMIMLTLSNTIGNGELIVSPNPTPNDLHVQTGFLQAGKLSLRLFDAQGKLLYQNEEAVTSFNTKTIHLSAYASSMYLLQAVFTPDSGEARKRTYKILRLP